MKQNCYRLLRLTNNIIDSNKLEAGFIVLHKKNMDIIRIVEDITLSVVEEAYYEFPGETVAGKINECSRLVVLRTLSKGFFLAGQFHTEKSGSTGIKLLKNFGELIR